MDIEVTDIMLRDCLEWVEGLTSDNFDARFIRSLAEQWKATYSLSERQQESLLRIHVCLRREARR